MKILVTGSAGHLGEALMRTLRARGDEPVGMDLAASDYTDCVGSVLDRSAVRECIAGCDAVLHTATLHKPHVGTHSRQDFVDTNVSGTLNLLEEAIEAGCRAFIYTSTTSTFGDAMQPAAGGPAVWVTEALRPSPKNIYGVTKVAAEDLFHLFHRNTGLPCLVLRTSRFFPDIDDDGDKRDAFTDENLKVNELLFRRADIEDVVSAHLCALAEASEIGFDRFIVTATTPFTQSDVAELGADAPAVLARLVPGYVEEFHRRGWCMFPTIGRVYDNAHAREVLGWVPQHNFNDVLQRLSEDGDYQSELARIVGVKGYHGPGSATEPYPVKGF